MASDGMQRTLVWYSWVVFLVSRESCAKAGNEEGSGHNEA